MSEPVIKVENLGKKYIIGHKVEGGTIQGGFPTLRDRITESANWLKNQAISKLTGKPIASPAYEEFWALKDVSFEINQGDRVGIIGRNGAGKSTLLKILSRITEPTTGQIEITGRVASLLEVGTGFHPELTGRENIYLNGAILGMSKTEIKKKFDEIVDFAEIEKFLDTPVKRYSSGMYVRLAFAVAAHLEPEILIVDEVLAVGDVQFQKKCLGKMDDVAREGRTVIIVSHNMLSIENLCSKTICLYAGKIIEQGDTNQVVSNYLQTSFSPLSQQFWQNITTAPGNNDIRLYKALVRPQNGTATDSIYVFQSFVMEFEFWNLQPEAYLNVNLQLYNHHGILVFETAPVHDTGWLNCPFPVGLFRYTCKIPSNFLNNGLHRVIFCIVKNRDLLLHKEEDILIFEIEDSMEYRDGWHGAWEGVVRPILEWETSLIEPIDKTHFINY
jgi:lipopolysaccharide transport system ATP-binding protein